MRLLETLTIQQKLTMIDGTPVGIFPTMILPDDDFYSMLPQMCVGYYLSHSSEKTISPTYENFIRLVTENTDMERNEDELMGSYIRAKFIDKWKRVYETLTTEYSAIDNRDWSVTRTGNNQNVETYNSDKERIGINTDEIEYGSTITNDGNVGSKETTTSSSNVANDVYGFNSSTPVGDNTSADTSTDTTERDYDSNKSHNVEARTGSDTKTYGINEDEKHRGTDTTDITINESLTHTGRDGSAAEHITEELEMRKREIFFDIVFRDIDSVATLAIYI